MQNKKAIFFLIVFLLYTAPTFIQPIFIENNKVAGVTLGLPTVQTGDEPHYYITLYSLVNDYDIFLTNNYNNALYRNGPDLGKKQFFEYDRHTQLFDSENKTLSSMFNNSKSIDLSYIPAEDSVIKEISLHPIGLPVFVFMFLWPFANTPMLEHFAIYLTLIFSLVGVYYFCKIMQHYNNNVDTSLFYTFIFAFATPYWHYAKTFWSEPYLASFLIVGWYFCMVKKKLSGYLFAGFLVGFGFTMKYPFIITAIPFGLYLLYKKQIKELITFSVPVLILILSVLLFNHYLTNNPFRFNQMDAVSFVNPLTGMVSWLFNPTFGLITFSPVLIFAVLGVWRFWKKDKINSVMMLSVIVPYFIFWAAYIVAQKGSGGYSARYLVPVISFIVFFCSFSDAERSKSKILRYGFYTLLSISIFINLLAAFAYPAFTGYPIMTSFVKIINFV